MKVKNLNIICTNVLFFTLLSVIFKTAYTKVLWFRIDGLSQKESDLKVSLIKLILFTKRQIFLTRRLSAYDWGLKNYYNRTEEDIFVERVLQNVTAHNPQLDNDNSRLFLNDLIEAMKTVRFKLYSSFALRGHPIHVYSDEHQEIENLNKIYFYRTVKLMLLLKEIEHFRYSEKCIKKFLKLVNRDKYLKEFTRHILYRAFESICLIPLRHDESVFIENTFKSDINVSSFFQPPNIL